MNCGEIFFILLNLVRLSLQDFSGIPSLLDPPNAHLTAKIVDKKSGDEYNLEEFVDGIGKRGHISVSQKSQNWSIFYSLESDETRLSFHDNICTNHRLIGNKWNRNLININNEIIQTILFLGPSIFLRLQKISGQWSEAVDGPFRGLSRFKVLTINLGSSFMIKEYFAEIGPGKVTSSVPIRITFSGNFSQEFPDQQTDSIDLILDYYIVEELIKPYEHLVTATLGVGCFEGYLESSSGPERSGYEDIIQFTEKSIRSDVELPITMEIKLSNKHSFARYIKYFGSDVTEKIVDYTIGIEYDLRSNVNGSCKYGPISRNDPAYVPLGPLADDKGHFDIKHFFWTNKAQYYVGSTYDINKEMYCHVWEGIEKNVTLDGDLYSFVVTTIYFANQGNDLPVIPVELIRTAYDTNNGKRVLKLSHRREIYNFRLITWISINELEECYISPKQSRYFSFLFQTQDSNPIDALKFAESNVISMKHGICELLSSSGTVFNYVKLSFTRMTDVELDFSDNLITARVKILEAPNVLAGYISSQLAVSKEFIGEKYQAAKRTLDDCASFASETLRDFLFCPDDNEPNSDLKLCRVLSTSQSIPIDENYGTHCDVYRSSSKNLPSLASQSKLINIKEEFRVDLLNNQKDFSFTVIDKLSQHQYTFTLVDMMSEPFASGSSLIFSNSKLITDSTKSVSLSSKVIKSLRDCNEACKESKLIECRIWSYCSNNGQVECVLTSQSVEDTVNSITDSQNCNVYNKAYLIDFTRHHDSIYKLQTTYNSDAKSDEECAKHCYQSNTCSSFQFCERYKQCSLNNQPFDSEIIKSDNYNMCSVYGEKHINKYQLTGFKLVETVFIVIESLTLEECASLCYTSSEQKCLSFNYCPGNVNSSSCQLSELTTSDSTRKSSYFCENYQLDKTIRSDNNDTSDTTIKSNRKAKVRLDKAAITVFVGLFCLGFVIGAAVTIVCVLCQASGNVNWYPVYISI